MKFYKYIVSILLGATLLTGEVMGSAQNELSDTGEKEEKRISKKRSLSTSTLESTPDFVVRKKMKNVDSDQGYIYATPTKLKEEPTISKDRFYVDEGESAVLGAGKIIKIEFREVVSNSKSENYNSLCTDCLFYCTAFCMEGVDKDNNTIKALTHWDAIAEAREIFYFLKSIMINECAMKEGTLKTYLIGPAPSEIWRDAFMKCKDEYNIQNFIVDKEADGEIASLELLMEKGKISYWVRS